MKGTTAIPGVCVLIHQDDKYLFVLRQNTGWKDGEYGLSGGYVEPGESFTEAARREVAEETGIEIDMRNIKHLLSVHRKSFDSIRVDLYFEVSKWEGEAYAEFGWDD